MFSSPVSFRQRVCQIPARDTYRRLAGYGLGGGRWTGLRRIHTYMYIQTGSVKWVLNRREKPAPHMGAPRRGQVILAYIHETEAILIVVFRRK